MSWVVAIALSLLYWAIILGLFWWHGAYEERHSDSVSASRDSLNDYVDATELVDHD